MAYPLTFPSLDNLQLASPAFGTGEAGRTVLMVAACPFPAPRGTPIRVLRMAEELASRGHRVHVVAYHLGVGEVDPRVVVHRIRDVTGYRSLRPGPSARKLAQLDPMLVRAVSSVLAREPVDVIHAHHFEGLLVGWAARSLRGHRVPLVFDAHTLLTSELPSYDLGIPRWLTRAAAVRGDRWLPRLADHVASCTERIRTRLLEIGAMPAERVTVVPNGVELLRFATGDVQRSSGVPRLVFTGNLARYQGIDLMLAALKRVRERRPRTRLLLVTAESFDAYDAEARALGVRDAIDIVTASAGEEPRLIASADVALNPRVDCDGIPMKLLNYMAAGRPVVSFAGSAPGLLHGQTAWLARDGDVDGFAAGIITLLDEPVFGRRMAENARRFVQATHTWARSAELAEEMYGRLLAPLALAR